MNRKWLLCHFLFSFCVSLSLFLSSFNLFVNSTFYPPVVCGVTLFQQFKNSDNKFDRISLSEWRENQELLGSKDLHRQRHRWPESDRDARVGSVEWWRGGHGEEEDSRKLLRAHGAQPLPVWHAGEAWRVTPWVWKGNENARGTRCGQVLGLSDPSSHIPWAGSWKARKAFDSEISTASWLQVWPERWRRGQIDGKLSPEL